MRRRDRSSPPSALDVIETEIVEPLGIVTLSSTVSETSSDWHPSRSVVS